MQILYCLLHPHDYVEKRASKDPNIKVFYERLCDYEENIAEMRALTKCCL